VLVTGGARGIGRGIAEAFLKAGASVMVADLGSAAADWAYDLAGNEELERTVAEQAVLGEVRATQLDVTVKASCEEAVASTIRAFAGLDVLVNNAGVVQSGATEDFSEADWDRIFAVNTKGIFLMTQAAIPALKKSAHAAIINTASIAGKKGHPGMAAYWVQSSPRSELPSRWRWNWPATESRSTPSARVWWEPPCGWST